MIFKKLILNNIGPYEGVNSFTFDIEENKNTILIGGKNGAGKTTFLNSVRLALYGSLAYGFKTESKEYLRKVSSLFNSKARADQSNSGFHVQINFSTVENLKPINVSIIRSWSINKTTIKENVDIIKNENHLNHVEKDEFYENLRTDFPPSLLELCFFDGEDISYLSNDDKLSSYLKELSSKLFNLDLFQNLDKDIKNYLSQTSKTKLEEKLEIEKINIENELNSKSEELRKIEDEVEQNQNKLTDIKEEYNSIKNEFSLHGGLIHEERNQIQEKIINIEMERKHLNEKIKDFISNNLPFFISLPVLTKLVEQLKSEQDFHTSNLLNKKINKLSVQSILEALGVKNTSDKESTLKETLLKSLSHNQDIKIIHNTSNSEAQQIYNLLSNSNLNKLQEINELIVKNKSKLTELSTYRKQLKDNESSSEFNSMIITMERKSKTINEIEQNLDSLYTYEKHIKDEIANINSKYERVRKEIYNIHKTKSSFTESEKVLNISKKFQENQLRKKIIDVEYFSSKMLKSLLRKDLFIDNIKIDFKTFNILLVDHENNEINKDILSAGEKELLVLSIIWGTITSSKKQVPFVLDTLLGRLDLEHKSSIITKLIPAFGKQTIILSTDSEIGNDLYTKLIPYISNEYTLSYDNKNKQTTIEKHFFNNNSIKVGK